MPSPEKYPNFPRVRHYSIRTEPRVKVEAASSAWNLARLVAGQVQAHVLRQK